MASCTPAFSTGDELPVDPNATLNDAILEVTGGPTINDGLALWYNKQMSESLNDAEFRWLTEQGALQGTINDKWFAYLRNSGYTGALNDMQLQYWRSGGASSPVATPEADAVVARMTNLSAAEETAVRNFVNGCVDDGNWAKLDEFFCFALNQTDALTGFKAFTATIPILGDPVFTLNGITLGTGVNNHIDTDVRLPLAPNYNLNDSEAGVYLHTQPAWGSGNNDLFGTQSGLTAPRLRMRHRGDDTNDFAASINGTATVNSPLSVASMDNTLYTLKATASAAELYFNGVLQPDAVGAQPTVPTTFAVWRGVCNDSDSELQPCRGGKFTTFYVGAALDNLAFYNRLTTFHTALGVT